MEKSPFFGLTWQGSLASLDPLTLSLRMYQISFDWGESELCQILPKSGTLQNGRLYQLNSSTSHISESAGSALLPTPTASDPAKQCSGGLHRLMVTGEKYSQNHYKNLPTPTAHLPKETACKNGYRKKNKTLLAHFMDYEPNPQERNRLNPQFVEWMMGFPQGFTMPD